MKRPVSPVAAVLASGALAIGVPAAAHAAPAAPALPAMSSARGIPSDCYAGSVSVSTSRYRYFVSSVGGQKRNSTRLKQKPLPFQPRHIALTHESWAGDGGTERHLAFDSKGRAFVWNQSINDYSGTGKYSMKRISGNWAKTTALTASKKYIYRLSGRALIRYEIGRGGVPTKGKTVAHSSFANVKTLSWEYSTSQTDTIIATTKSGALLQIKVRRNSAGSGTYQTLRKSGYQNFVTFEAGGCWNHPTAGSYFGRTRTGGIYAYYDRDRRDASANYTGGRVGSWSHRTY